MNKINNFLTQYFKLIVIILLVVLFFRSCTNSTSNFYRKLSAIEAKLDTIENNAITKKDLQLEGLKSEKRMIQSTDRKMLDVSRQSEIDREIEKLSK